jgi:hypothetical protein
VASPAIASPPIQNGQYCSIMTCLPICQLANVS